MSMSVCFIYYSSASQNSSTEPSTYCWCKGMWTGGTQKPGSSLEPSPFALQSLFPSKVWHSTLTRIQCGPVCYKLSLRRNSSLSYICESFHSHLFFSRHQSLLWAHFNPPAELLFLHLMLPGTFLACVFSSFCLLPSLFSPQDWKALSLQSLIYATVII